jgi:hypothetical protein
VKLLKALIVAAGLALAPLAQATTALLVGTADTGGTPNTSGSYSPISGRLQVAFVQGSATVQATCTLTNSAGLTFTQFATITHQSNQHALYAFVADALTSVTSSQSVTADCDSDPANGTVIFVYETDGVTRTGTDAIAQSKAVTSADTAAPTATFDASAITTNPTLVFTAASTANPMGITPPTNWTEPATGDLGYDTPTFGAETAFRDSGFTGTTITWGSDPATSQYGVIIVEVDRSSAVAAFDTPPTVSAETTSVYTLSYNANADSVTFFAVAMAKDASAPADCDAVEAGTGAIATASEAVTGGADTTDLTISGGDPFPLYDLYGCVEGAGGDSAVTALVDETLDVPSGRQYVVKSGSPGVGEDGLLDGADPASADDDYIDGPVACDSFAEGLAANTLTINADTTYIIDTDGDTSRQTCTRRFYDVSAADWSDADPVALYVNNQAPVYTGLESFLFEVGTAFEYDVTSLFTDAEGDAMTLTEQDGPGSVVGDDWEGTFDTCGVSSDVDWTATDIAGDVGAGDDDVTVGAFVPDVVGDDEATATAAIEALCSFTATAGTPIHSSTVAAGLVISTDPEATTLAPPTENVIYILSLGEAASAGDGALKVVFVIASDAGLTRWVDYIPVSDVPGCTAGTYAEDGCWEVDVIASTDGLTAWVDYIPVFEVSQTANKWRYENDGWIPVDTLTP